MVDGLTEMGELVASLTERAEGERRERELAGLGAMQDAMQVRGAMGATRHFHSPLCAVAHDPGNVLIPRCA